MQGVDHDLILDNQRLERILIDALKEDKFTFSDKDIIIKDFEPQGLSVTVALEESHACIHTYPEYNSMTFSLYSCRAPFDGIITYERVKAEVNPSLVSLKQMPIIVDKVSIVEKAVLLLAYAYRKNIGLPPEKLTRFIYPDLLKR